MDKQQQSKQRKGKSSKIFFFLFLLWLFSLIGFAKFEENSITFLISMLFFIIYPFFYLPLFLIYRIINIKKKNSLTELNLDDKIKNNKNRSKKNFWILLLFLGSLFLIMITFLLYGNPEVFIDFTIFFLALTILLILIKRNRLKRQLPRLPAEEIDRQPELIETSIQDQSQEEAPLSIENTEAIPIPESSKKQEVKNGKNINIAILLSIVMISGIIALFTFCLPEYKWLLYISFFLFILSFFVITLIMFSKITGKLFIPLVLIIIIFIGFFYVNYVNHVSGKKEYDVIVFDNIPGISAAAKNRHNVLYFVEQKVLYYPQRSNNQYVFLITPIVQCVRNRGQFSFSASPEEFNLLTRELLFLDEFCEEKVNIRNVGKGAYDSVESIFTSVWDMVRHPVQNSKSLYSAGKSGAKLAEKLINGETSVDELKSEAHEFVEYWWYNAQCEKAEEYNISYQKAVFKESKAAIGNITKSYYGSRIAGEVLTVFCGYAAVAKLSKATKLAKAATIIRGGSKFGRLFKYLKGAKISKPIAKFGVKPRENFAKLVKRKKSGAIEANLNVRNIELSGKKHPVTGISFNKGGFPIFKSVKEVKLPRRLYKASDKEQFEFATKKLFESVKKQPNLAKQFSKKQLDQIKIGITPSGYTWHHHQLRGKLQLVDSATHQATGHTGGKIIWGGGSDYR